MSTETLRTQMTNWRTYPPADRPPSYILDDIAPEVLAALDERDRLRVENHTLRTLIESCDAKQREDAIVHIRLRAALREAADELEDLWRSENNDEPPDGLATMLATWRALVQP